MPPNQAAFFLRGGLHGLGAGATGVHITETSPDLFSWFTPRVHITETNPVLFRGRRFRRRFFTWFAPRVHITETSPVLFIGRRFRRRFFTWFAPRVHITETIPDFFTWFTPRCATRGAHSPPACLDRDVHDGDAVPYLAHGRPSARPSPG